MTSLTCPSAGCSDVGNPNPQLWAEVSQQELLKLVVWSSLRFQLYAQPKLFLSIAGKQKKVSLIAQLLLKLTYFKVLRLFFEGRLQHAAHKGLGGLVTVYLQKIDICLFGCGAFLYSVTFVLHYGKLLRSENKTLTY